eukprot:5835701-Prymnesium_polylepis.1
MARRSAPDRSVGVRIAPTRGVAPTSKRRKQPWFTPPTCQQSAGREAVSRYDAVQPVATRGEALHDALRVAVDADPYVWRVEGASKARACHHNMHTATHGCMRDLCISGAADALNYHGLRESHHTHENGECLAHLWCEWHCYDDLRLQPAAWGRYSQSAFHTKEFNCIYGNGFAPPATVWRPR